MYDYYLVFRICKGCGNASASPHPFTCNGEILAGAVHEYVNYAIWGIEMRRF